MSFKDDLGTAEQHSHGHDLILAARQEQGADALAEVCAEVSVDLRMRCAERGWTGMEFLAVLYTIAEKEGDDLLELREEVSG